MRGKLRRGAILAAIIASLAVISQAQQVMERIRQLDAQAREQERQGDAEAAIKDYQEIIKLDPKLTVAYNNLGRIYYQEGRFEEALAPLKRAMELDPHIEAPHALTGLCLYQMDEFKEARQELQTALRLNPRDTDAKLYLARSLMGLNDTKSAVKMLEQLQEADPKNVEVLFSLGWAYSGLAVSTLDAIQRADPNSYLTDLLLGKYAEVKQLYSEAAGHYRDAIAKAPNQPELHYCYAHTLFASGDNQHALDEYRRVLEMNPYDYRASWEAARIILPDNPEEAYQLANRALQLRPGVYGALETRGRALLALGKTSEAIADFKQVAALNPRDAANHFQLARAYQKQGMTQEAQAETAIYQRIQREEHFSPAGETSGQPHSTPANP